MDDVKLGSRGFEPQTFDELWRYADTYFLSGLVPRSMTSTEQVFVCMSLAKTLGIPVALAPSAIMVVDGKPTVWGDYALALVRSSGLLVDGSFREWEETAADGTAIWFSEGKRGKETICRSFSMADAKRAGLWDKDIWRKYPGRMLQMRARGFMLRDLFPDVLKGVYLAEELQDMDARASAPTALAAPVMRDMADAMQRASAPAAVPAPLAIENKPPDQIALPINDPAPVEVPAPAQRMYVAPANRNPVPRHADAPAPAPVPPDASLPHAAALFPGAAPAQPMDAGEALRRARERLGANAVVQQSGSRYSIGRATKTFSGEVVATAWLASGDTWAEALAWLPAKGRMVGSTAAPVVPAEAETAATATTQPITGRPRRAKPAGWQEWWAGIIDVADNAGISTKQVEACTATFFAELTANGKANAELGTLDTAERHMLQGRIAALQPG